MYNQRNIHSTKYIESFCSNEEQATNAMWKMFGEVIEMDTKENREIMLQHKHI